MVPKTGQARENINDKVNDNNESPISTSINQAETNNNGQTLQQVK